MSLKNTSRSLALLFTSFLIAASAQVARADGPAVEASISMGGALGLSYTDGSAFMNFAGPNLKLNLPSQFAVGASFYPSLRYATTTSAFSTALGIGPFAEYRRFQVIVPFYVINSVMTPTFGIGYRF